MAKTIPQPAPAAKNAPTAKPGTPDPIAAKPKRAEYVAPQGAAWVDASGKLTAIPDDFDPKKHVPLQRKAFADDGLFWEMRAVHAEKQAVEYRRRAEESKRLGGVKDKAKAKQLIRMVERLEALKKQLADQGLDPAAILGAAVAAPEEG